MDKCAADHDFNTTSPTTSMFAVSPDLARAKEVEELIESFNTVGRQVQNDAAVVPSLLPAFNLLNPETLFNVDCLLNSNGEQRRSDEAIQSKSGFSLSAVHVLHLGYSGRAEWTRALKTSGLFERVRLAEAAGQYFLADA